MNAKDLEKDIEKAEDKAELEMEDLSTKTKFPVKLFLFAVFAYSVGIFGAYGLHIGDLHLQTTNQTAYQATPAATHLGINTGIIYIVLALTLIVGMTLAIIKLKRLNIEQFLSIFYLFIMFYLPFALITQLMLIESYSYLAILLVAVPIGLAVALIYRHHRQRINVWAMLIAISAIILIGSDIPPIIILALLCLAAVWDYIAVFVIHYMQEMVKRMASFKIMPPIAFIDGKPEDLIAKLNAQATGSKFNKEVGLLGLGDVILPGAVIASFTYFGFYQLGIAMFGATLLGLWLDISWSRWKHIAIPALCLIALADIAVLAGWLLLGA